ncbi:hypothetical protein FMEAI12_6460004 [Parafrankia sp. Ea1.12]|nr:hypothetical protein FMEAI12_6460004 [Parafrankia sp. Ea1.12]
MTLTPASWANSSRRRPGTRRRSPYWGRPTVSGRSFARRDFRKPVNSARVSTGIRVAIAWLPNRGRWLRRFRAHRLVDMTANLTSREIRLAGRPVGEPGAQHFELVHQAVPPLAEGQILVRNTWMSVDPYMRGRMDETPSYIPAFQYPGVPARCRVGGQRGRRGRRLPLRRDPGRRDRVPLPRLAGLRRRRRDGGERRGRRGRAAAGVPRPARHHRAHRLRGADGGGAGPFG